MLRLRDDQWDRIRDHFPEEHIPDTRIEQETIRMQGVLLQVKTEVRDALLTLAGAEEQLAIAQSGVKASQLELTLARERFAVLTTSSNIEVTNALFSVSRARENVVDALFRLNAARVHLARAIGDLERIY